MAGIAARATLWLGLCAAGCYSPPEPVCGFLCGSDGACPDGYSCQLDKVCHRNDSPNAPCGHDAGTGDGSSAAPFVVSTMPANATSGVPVDTTIQVVFDEAVTGVDATTFSVFVAGSPFAATVTATNPTTYVSTPTSPLPSATQIQVVLENVITDLAGHPLATTMFSFTTQ